MREKERERERETERDRERERERFRQRQRERRSGRAKVNITVLGLHRKKRSMTTCPEGHMTCVFLACDVTAACWADSDVTFSLRPETWALCL